MSVFRKKREAGKFRITRKSHGQKRHFKTVDNKRLYGEISRAPIPANELVRRYQRTLRAQCRQEANSNGYATRFLQLCQQNIVGPAGFDLQGRTLFVTAGQQPQSDDAANSALERAWRDWSRPENCDVYGRQSLVSLDQTTIRTVALDGEIFIRKYQGRAFGPYGFQLQLLDPELVDITFNEDRPGGLRIRMGIEYDGMWRPTAYYLRESVSSSSAYYYSASNGQTYTRVPANEIYHLFIPNLVGQFRGLPWMSASLSRMHMAEGGEEAAITNFRMGASKMGFYKNVGDPEVLSDEQRKWFDENGQLVDEVEPGQLPTLPPGVDFEAFDPKYPNGDYSPFMERVLKGVAAGLGISYHGLTQDLANVNYSTGRIGRIDEQDLWMMLQDWMIDTYKQRCYNDWLDQQLLMTPPTITINGTGISPARADKYRAVEFNGRRWSSVDPQKTQNANRMKLEMRTTSLTRIMKSEGITDPQAEWRQLARDKEDLESLGLVMADVIQPAALPQELPQGQDNET